MMPNRRSWRSSASRSRKRERSEFRLLQEQASLVRRQERLDFLYDSGVAVGKGISDGFKALETFHKTDPQTASSSSAKRKMKKVNGWTWRIMNLNLSQRNMVGWIKMRRKLNKMMYRKRELKGRK
ncbi:uncharacterized protein LOC130773107 isoform X2 [Actinidia eriantha]|uniref:uncharacterized protein LOC130773107 isoform X2 n=1 Tax=Actinidia eriantha TaxID=165200 RepID=UPI00258610C1|nr:uncharacterized protein LOC130773107 isoform X2 [Actinidia eriantha]